MLLATLLVSIGAVIGLQASPDTFVMGAVSIVGTLTGTWCVIAVNKQRLSNYIFGLVNVIAFGVLYAHWGLYGMAALNIFYPLSQCNSTGCIIGSRIESLMMK